MTDVSPGLLLQSLLKPQLHVAPEQADAGDGELNEPSYPSYQLLPPGRDVPQRAEPQPLGAEQAVSLPLGALEQQGQAGPQPDASPQQVQIYSPRYHQQNFWQIGDDARPGRMRSRSTGRAAPTPRTPPHLQPPTPGQPSTPRVPATPRRRASAKLDQIRDGVPATPPRPSAPSTPQAPLPERLPPVPQVQPATPAPSEFPFSPEFPFSAEPMQSADFDAPLDDEHAQGSTIPAEAAQSATQHAAEASQQVDDDGPLPQLPAKRTHDALQASKVHKFKYLSGPKPKDLHSILLTHFVLDALTEITQPGVGWDGSPPSLAYGPPCVAFRCAAAKILNEEVSSDSSNDEESAPTAGLTRQERKAIDREIPWRKLMSDYPSDIISLYVQANKKEYDSWMSWQSIRALTPTEAAHVRSDPVLRRRIMPSRNAYRDKNRGAGPSVKAKCRTVIQGCHDPDLGLLDRSSPTPTRLAEYVIYEIACAGYNQRFQNNKKAWKLWAGDVSTAFLQGQPQPQARDMPIFMRPPRDDIQAMAGAFTSELYEVVGKPLRSV